MLSAHDLLRYAFSCTITGAYRWSLAFKCKHIVPVSRLSSIWLDGTLVGVLLNDSSSQLFQGLTSLYRFELCNHQSDVVEAVMMCKSWCSTPMSQIKLVWFAKLASLAPACPNCTATRAYLLLACIGESKNACDCSAGAHNFEHMVTPSGPVLTVTSTQPLLQSTDRRSPSKHALTISAV